MSAGTVSSRYSGVLPLGAYISKVEDGSPAQAAGIQVDDIIVDVDGTVVQSSNQLVNLLAKYSADDTIKVKLYRSESLKDGQYVGDGSVDNGQYVDVEVTLRMMDEAQP